MKASLCSLLILLILLSFSTRQEVSGAGTVPENVSELAWKLPVGDIKFVAVSDGGQILLPVLFDGYYDYDAKGGLAWRLSDPHASYGELSADGHSALLVQETQTLEEKEKASLIDTSGLKERWTYALDLVDYARLSAVNLRTAIVGRNFAAGVSGSENLLVVKDGNGADILNLKFGGESDFGSAPAISPDGRYVAVGTWGREERDYWLFFVDLESRTSWNATIHNGVKFVAIASDATVAAAGPEGLRLFDKNGNQLWSGPLPDLFLESYPIRRESRLWISDSGEYIAVADTLGYAPIDEGHAILFDRSGKQLWDFRTSTEITAFAMDKASSRIVVGDSNGVVYILDRSGTVLSKRGLASFVRSVAIGGKPAVIAAVGDENTMYAMDSQANLLWTHMEIGSSRFNVQTSQDGNRILVAYSSGYSSGATVLDDVGKRILARPIRTSGPHLSALSSDGKLLVVATETENESALSWFDVDTGRQLRNITLGKGTEFDSLSMSQDASLVAVSGMWGNHTFIRAFDSLGHELWKQLTETTGPTGGHYDVFYVRSNVAVSGDGLYVAAARREMTPRLGMICGGNNGIVLFDAHGRLLWNYTTPECVWNIALSGDGQYVAAATHSRLHEFDRDGRPLWSEPIERVCVDGCASSIIAISGTGQRFAAGESGKLLLGNTSSPYWRIEVKGEVESVSISDSGNLSTTVVSNISSNRTSTIRLIYIVDNDGRLLGNYTSVGPLLVDIGGSQVSMSANGCCVAAALERDGLYFFKIGPEETSRGTIQTSSTTQGIVGKEVSIHTVAVTLLVVAIAAIVLVFVMKGRYRARTPA